MAKRIISQIQIKRKNRRMTVTKVTNRTNEIGYLLEAKVLPPNSRIIHKEHIFLSAETIGNVILAMINMGILTELVQTEPINFSIKGLDKAIADSFTLTATKQK